jgi:hypothetical protein
MRNLIGAVVLLTLAAGVGRSEGPKTYRQYHIEATWLRGDPLGSQEAGTIECLSRPTIMTVEGQAAVARIGQERQIDGEKVDIGFEVGVTPRQVKGGIELNLVLAHTEVVQESENTLLTQSTKSRYIRTVKPGEVLRLRVGKPGEKQTWVELKARVVGTVTID